MQELVILKNKEAVTTSLQVAESFEKKHRHVLSAIDELKEGLPKIGQTYFGKIRMFILKINNHIELFI